MENKGKGDRVAPCLAEGFPQEKRMIEMICLLWSFIRESEDGDAGITGNTENFSSRSFTHPGGGDGGAGGKGVFSHDGR